MSDIMGALLTHRGHSTFPGAQSSRKIVKGPGLSVVLLLLQQLYGYMNTVCFNLYWMQILTMVWTCLFTSTTTLRHGDVHYGWKVVCLDGSFTRYLKPSPISNLQSITSKLTSGLYHSEGLAAPFSFPFSKKIPEIKILSFYFPKLTPFFLPFSHSPVNYSKSLIFGK